MSSGVPAHLPPDAGMPEPKKSRPSYPDFLRGFWNALEKAELKDGCVTLPGGHVWDEYGTRTIFVRDCYEALADTILHDAGLLAADHGKGAPTSVLTRCWTVLGNPGA